MRVGLDLRSATADGAVEAAIAADGLGLWAVLLSGAPGAESLVAAEVATVTDHIHLAVQFDPTNAHPVGIAEEVAILDHLSARRAIAVVQGGPGPVTEHVRRLLAGEIVDGVALAPPPAQTAVPTWAGDELAAAALTGDLEADRRTIDDRRDGGATHLFVTWPGDPAVLARHLVTRALGPDFPDLVAEYADTIAPLGT